MPFIKRQAINNRSGINPTTPTIQTNLDSITYNPRYPGFDEYNYKKLESKIDALGLTGYEKEQAMDEAYQQVLPMVQNQIKNSDRRKYINEAQYEVSQMPEGNDKKIANGKLSVVQLTQLVKEKYDIDPSAPDQEVFDDWLETIPNGEQLLANYMNTGDKTLLYEGGLAEKPKETFGEKYADFMAGVMQSPGKWGYNMVGQWMDKAGHRGAEKILGHEIATDEDTFKGREATDITDVLVGEDRANSGWTKAGEVVGDIASGIALTAPAGATLAPMFADSTVLGAGILGGTEGILDTALTHYGREGDLNLTPTEAIVGTVGGILGGEMSRYLANLPKSQADSIRKEAEGYINKSIKPKTKANITKADIDKFTDDTLDVFKQMVQKNAKGEYELIQYTDDAGNIIKGKLPTNTQETVEALDNLKKIVFNQYDDIGKKAGLNGARVDLNKVFDNLDDLSKDVGQGLGNSNTSAIVNDFKDRLLEYTDDVGTISIKDAQKVQQEYNLQLKNFFNNVSNTSDDVSKAGITAKVNRWVGDAIDDAIDNGYGGTASIEYRQLKHLYGQIRNVEKELTKRVSQQLKNTGALPSDILDAVSGGEFTQAMLTLDPVKLAKAGAIKGINQYLKRLKNPNTNISKLFKLVDSVENPSTIQTVSSNIGNAIKGGLQKSANLIPEVVVPGGISASEALNND